MRRHITMTLVLTIAGAQAQEAMTFQAPRPYDAQRYEAGWSKTPFTLKTIPVAMEQASFAKDLAIGSYYGDTENPTVVVVNTKTGERTRLQQGRPAANGMMLKNFKHGSGRKDAVAEVTLGPETTQLHYNDDYVRQIAAAEGARGATQGAAVPGRTAIPGTPQGQPTKPAVNGPVSATGQTTIPMVVQASSGGYTAPVSTTGSIPLPGMLYGTGATDTGQTTPHTAKSGLTTAFAGSSPSGPSLRRLVTPPSSTPTGTSP